MKPPTLPADPLSRFVRLYEALNRDRGFWGDASSLRFAAMAVITCPGEPTTVAAALRATAEEIKKLSGWFGSLSSELRFIVSALILVGEDSPDAFLGEVTRVRELFRRYRLRRGGIYETMAILVMRQRHDLHPIPESSIERFQALYEEMKRHHWWLTGPDDFPACAILVGEPGTPEEIGQRVENIYQALTSEGFSAGDPLQTAANILCLAQAQPETLATRYHRLAEGFRDQRVSIWQSDYDELAILSFLEHPTAFIVERVLEHRRKMEALRPKPDSSLTFNLAAGLAFLDLVQLDGELKTITDTKALMDMQAIISAQQAAAAAAASSAAATNTSNS